MILNTSEIGVTVFENGNPTSYHFQNVKPYFTRLNTILTSLIMIFLFSLNQANEVVAPISSNSGMLFFNIMEPF